MFAFEESDFFSLSSRDLLKNKNETKKSQRKNDSSD